MFCPICGFENLKDARFCESCGESLLKEINYGEKKKIISGAMILTFLLIFGGMFSKTWQISVIGIFAFLSSIFAYKLLPRLSGSHAKRYCPQCEESEFNDNFCINCGYNLDDVLGYYKTDKHDIEMNKKTTSNYRTSL